MLTSMMQKQKQLSLKEWSLLNNYLCFSPEVGCDEKSSHTQSTR